MTAEAKIANVFVTLAAAAVLWGVCRYLVLPTLRDSLRLRLFALRREMFIYMVEGGIDPDHPAYGRVRSFMNTAIRYADGLSLVRSIVGAATAGRYGKQRVRAMDDAIATLPEETGTRIKQFKKRASTAIGFYMLARSPLGWALFLIVVLAAIAMLFGSLLKRAWARTWSDAMDVVRQHAEAETQILGCIEDEPAAFAPWGGASGGLASSSVRLAR
jgi:hypothetical protein